MDGIDSSISSKVGIGTGTGIKRLTVRGRIRAGRIEPLTKGAELDGRESADRMTNTEGKEHDGRHRPCFRTKSLA